MNLLPSINSQELQKSLDQRIAALQQARAEILQPPLQGQWLAQLSTVLLCSDFVFDCLRRDVQLIDVLEHLAIDAKLPSERIKVFDWGDESDESLMRGLRRFRQQESMRLIARDALNLDSVETTLQHASDLAQACLSYALDKVHAQFCLRFGTPRNPEGEAQQLVVIAMGKLGGGELNFSSDVDLIFAFPQAGQTDGKRCLDNEDFFVRLGQRLIQVIADVTVDGFAFRVDMRLRPFGDAGRMALSFAAMEQYYQREGRDWERYAWVKARPVAGDLDAGFQLTESLRPFVYRRYLDFTAIDGLRDMKAMIDAEVSRREFAEHIKLGPGGIREIEFVVQLIQLTRGGREPILRNVSLLQTLQHAAELDAIATPVAEQLRQAYLFLRRVENRLQMLRDEQIHELPEDQQSKQRLALGLGFASFDAFYQSLQLQRSVVIQEFSRVLEARKSRKVTAHGGAWVSYWRALRAANEPENVLVQDEVVHHEIKSFAQSPTLRRMSEKGLERLDKLMPSLLEFLSQSEALAPAWKRLLKFVNAICGRSSYLALLVENPAARERVCQIFAHSAFLAERVAAHPLLLDELLGSGSEDNLPTGAELAAIFERRNLADSWDDPEEALAILHDVRQSAAFRIALAWVDGKASADQVAQALAEVADALIAAALQLATQDAIKQFGLPQGLQQGEGMMVASYGSLGGAELGFASDLDLIFLFDQNFTDTPTVGTRSVDGARFFARVAQRVVHWLTTPTAAGPLYDVDIRLRPDGAKGLLVSSVSGFAEYQNQRAWLWEHQAIVRGRFVAGDLQLGTQFADIRKQVLCIPREAHKVMQEVSQMRERWRMELDRSNARRFDLKQGEGGLVDVEFMMQAIVLAFGATNPLLAEPVRSNAIIEAAAAGGLINSAEHTQLRYAHNVLLAASLNCTLDARPRVVLLDDALLGLRADIAAIAQRLGLAFSAEKSQL